MSEQRENPPASAKGHEASPPMYFPVSLLKLAVMSFCTFGLYEIYWFYRNWRLVKVREELSIVPILRSLFAVFFCYSLFTRIQDTADEQELPISLASGFLASGWIVTKLLANAPHLYWLASFFTVIFLLPVQSAVNDINRTVNPEHPPNKRFSGWDMAIVVVGGLALVASAEMLFSNGS